MDNGQQGNRGDAQVDGDGPETTNGRRRTKKRKGRNEKIRGRQKDAQKTEEEKGKEVNKIETGEQGKGRGTKDR